MGPNPRWVSLWWQSEYLRKGLENKSQYGDYSVEMQEMQDEVKLSHSAGAGKCERGSGRRPWNPPSLEAQTKGKARAEPGEREGLPP